MRVLRPREPAPLTDSSPEGRLAMLRRAFDLLDAVGAGGIPRDYTWSGFAIPYICMTVAEEGRSRLRDTLLQLGIVMETTERLRAYWERMQVRTLEAAHTHLTDLAAAQRPATTHPPAPFLLSLCCSARRTPRNRGGC